MESTKRLVSLVEKMVSMMNEIVKALTVISATYMLRMSSSRTFDPVMSDASITNEHMEKDRNLLRKKDQYNNKKDTNLSDETKCAIS